MWALWPSPPRWPPSIWAAGRSDGAYGSAYIPYSFLRLIVFHTTLTLNASPEAVNRRRPAFNPQNPCMPATLPIRRDSMTQTQVPDLTLADLSMLAQEDFTDRLA